MSSDGPAPAPRRVAFVLEQTLGHVTHSANLAALIPQTAADVGVEPLFLPIPFETGRAGSLRLASAARRVSTKTRRAERPVEAEHRNSPRAKRASKTGHGPGHG